MWKDPIVEEVRKTRDQIAKKKGYSLKKLFGNMGNKKTTKKRTSKKS